MHIIIVYVGGTAMPMTPKQIIKLLKKNGFIEKRQAGSHRMMYNPTKRISVVVPCHTKDLPIGTEQKILKQAGLK